MLNIVLTVIIAINSICIISLVFFERKRPYSTIVWVLILIFFPVIGLIFYLLFGSGLRFKKRRRYDIKAERDRRYQWFVMDTLNLPDKQRPYTFYAIQKQYGNQPPIKLIDIGGSITNKISHEKTSALINEKIKNIDPFSDGIIRFFHQSDLCFYSIGNSVELFTDGEKLFQSLIKDIASARKSINLLYYKINNDDTGRQLLELLTKKAKEGVRVRVLYDTLGSLSSTRRMFRALVDAGGQVEFFFPVRFAFMSYLKFNYRNHRKIVVVDDETGYVGGMNIGDEYRGRDRKLSPWRDTHLRIKGKASLFLQERFIMDWLDTKNEAVNAQNGIDQYVLPSDYGDVGVQIVSSGPDTENEEIKRGIIKMLTSARNYVYLQTPYFVPDEALLDALRIAAASGVDVRLMLPGINDVLAVHYTSFSYVGDLLEAGIKVYVYKGFIHAKTVVADDKVATVGTANLDIRSFALDFEVNAFIYDEKFAVHCKEVFLNDMLACREMTDWEYAGRSWGTKLIESVLRIFSPIM